jgi:23S rRNA pseudouridine1911/1915/1917 synthase
MKNAPDVGNTGRKWELGRYATAVRTPSDIRENSGRDNLPAEPEADKTKTAVLHEMEISSELAGHRLDYAISRELGVSRVYAQKLIKNGSVTPRICRRIKPSIKVELGEIYGIETPPPEKLDLEPEDIPFGVIYSDSDIIVVDKPAGLVVHPAPGHYRGTLVHGLLYRFPEFGSMNGVERPGIVHRLDATTSGLMVVARNGLALEKLYNEFKSRRVEKTYLFLCHGTPKTPRARIDMPIGRDDSGKKMTVRDDGRNAVTDYDVIWSNGEYSLAKCLIHTGRTHQIRVHMKFVGCPLVGDSLYAPSKKTPFPEARVFLHSWKLSFKHPADGVKIHFRSFIPADLKNLLLSIRGPRATATNPR